MPPAEAERANQTFPRASRPCSDHQKEANNDKQPSSNARLPNGIAFMPLLTLSCISTRCSNRAMPPARREPVQRPAHHSAGDGGNRRIHISTMAASAGQIGMATPSPIDQAPDCQTSNSHMEAYKNSARQKVRSLLSRHEDIRSLLSRHEDTWRIAGRLTNITPTISMETTAYPHGMAINSAEKENKIKLLTYDTILGLGISSATYLTSETTSISGEKTIVKHRGMALDR